MLLVGLYDDDDDGGDDDGDAIGRVIFSLVKFDADDAAVATAE